MRRAISSTRSRSVDPLLKPEDQPELGAGLFVQRQVETQTQTLLGQITLDLQRDAGLVLHARHDAAQHRQTAAQAVACKMAALGECTLADGAVARRRRRDRRLPALASDWRSLSTRTGIGAPCHSVMRSTKGALRQRGSR